MIGKKDQTVEVVRDVRKAFGRRRRRKGRQEKKRKGKGNNGRVHDSKYKNG